MHVISAQMGAIDRVSEIERLRLIEISTIVVDTWTHQRLPIKIEREIIVGLWPMIIAQSRPSIGLHRIGRSAFFAHNFLINIDVLLCILTFGQMVNKLSRFEGRS